MALFRSLVVIPALTGQSKDACANSWSWDITGPETSTMNSIEGVVRTFYDSWSGYRNALQAWNLTRIKWYRMTDTKPRAPVRDTSLGLSAATASTMLPPELAICMSFQGVRLSGTKQARRRGRLYLGPWGVIANTSSTGQIASGLLTTIGTAAAAVRVASQTSTDYEWVVISNTPIENANGTPVTDGWFDNAWDVQRRRGLQPGSRTLF